MSYVTPFIPFVLGVLIWHHQLSAKRRFEVAEQVLAAFPTASDGLSTLRSPMIWAAEIENAKPKKDKEGEDQADDEAPKDQEQGTATTRAAGRNAQRLRRAEAMSPAFADLRTAQILAEIHFGRRAADAIGVLFRGRQQVFAAIMGRYGGVFSDFYFPDAQRAEQHREFEVSMQRLLAEHRAEDGTPDDRPAIPANRCSTHGAGKRLSAVLGRPALAEEAVQPVAKARTRIGALRLLLREMPLAMLLAYRRPARIMAELLIRVQPVSLPGLVQREIDGILARNHRAPFEDSRTLMPCASSRSRIVRLGCSPSSVRRSSVPVVS
jgi:hypothetical protein